MDDFKVKPYSKAQLYNNYRKCVQLKKSTFTQHFIMKSGRSIQRLKRFSLIGSIHFLIQWFPTFFGSWHPLHGSKKIWRHPKFTGKYGVKFNIWRHPQKISGHLRVPHLGWLGSTVLILQTKFCSKSSPDIFPLTMECY